MLQRFDGRYLRISRSRRNNRHEILSHNSVVSSIDYATSSSSDDEYPSTGDGDYNHQRKVETPQSAYHLMREAAKKDLRELEDDFKYKFEATKIKARNLRKEKIEKEKSKACYERELAFIQTELAKCDIELATIVVEQSNNEKMFNTFAQEHSAKVDVVNERIKALRQEKCGVSTLPGPGDLLPPGINHDLDCCCCYETMGLKGAAIYQCTEGHLICPKCHQRLSDCPICRKPYKDSRIRNLMAETLSRFVYDGSSN